MIIVTAEFETHAVSREIQELEEKAELQVLERSHAWCCDCKTWFKKNSDDIWEYDDGWYCVECRPEGRVFDDADYRYEVKRDLAEE